MYTLFLSMSEVHFLHLLVADVNSTYYNDTGRYERRISNNNKSETLIFVDRTHFSRLTFGSLDILATAYASQKNGSTLISTSDHMSVVYMTIMTILVDMRDVNQSASPQQKSCYRAYLLQHDHVNILIKLSQSEAYFVLRRLLYGLCFTTSLKINLTSAHALKMLQPFLLNRLQALAQPNDHGHLHHDDNNQIQASTIVLPITDEDCHVANISC